MGDDNTVSFVFGLEVNWDLLQVSVEAKKEETAAYVAQVRRGVEERRREERRGVERR
jgi:hypothetical protein